MNKKYIVLVGILLAQLTIAALYAWSIFNTAIVHEYGWNEDQVLLTYAIAQFAFAFSTIFSGKLIDSKGPRITLFIGGILYASGLILSSYARSPIILYLTYGLISGVGVGFVYVVPLSTLIKWFPKHKGTITGLSVAVFGGGSIVFKEVISALIQYDNVSHAFLYLGIISLIIILLATTVTSNPEDYKKHTKEKTETDFSTKEMIKTKKFKQIWIMYWLAVIPGLLVLGAAKNIGLDYGLQITAAAGLVTVLALSNALSRLLSGSLSDKFGTLFMLKLVFIITLFSLLLLILFHHNILLFYTGIIGIAIGYGGFLTLFPTFTNEQFGSYRYASNYGIVFQAYGLAALSGIFIKSISGSYSNTFIISVIAGLLGLLLSFTLKRDKELNLGQNKTKL